MENLLHEIVEKQAETSADSIAVSSGDQHLTYREFNSRADTLASHLVHKGVGPGVLVGFCIDRSLELIIGCSEY